MYQISGVEAVYKQTHMIHTVLHVAYVYHVVLIVTVFTQTCA